MYTGAKVRGRAMGEAHENTVGKDTRRVEFHCARVRDPTESDEKEGKNHMYHNFRVLFIEK